MSLMEKDATSFHKYSMKEDKAYVEQLMRQLFMRVVSDHSHFVAKKKEQFVKGGADKKGKKGKNAKKKKKPARDEDDDDELSDDDGDGETIDIEHTDGEEEDDDDLLSNNEGEQNYGPDDEESRTEQLAEAMTHYEHSMKTAEEKELKLDYQLLLEPILHKSENEPGTDKNSTALKDRKIIAYRWIYINNSPHKLLTLFRKIHKKIAKDAAIMESDKKRKPDPNIHKYYILKDPMILAQHQAKRVCANFSRAMMGKIAKTNLDDPDSPINVLRLFSPMWSQSFMNDISLYEQALPVQMSNYMKSPLQYKFPEAKLSFVYRFMPTSLNIKMLTYCMMPHIQRKTIGQLTKMLPQVLDKLKDLSISASKEEQALLQQQQKPKRFDENELIKQQFETLRKRAAHNGDVKDLAYFEEYEFLWELMRLI